MAPLALAFVLAMRRRGTLSRRDVALLACVMAALGTLTAAGPPASAALPADGRWLRVYVAARGSQLYASIQNSAVEDPSFNQRNYISEKRGNHGLGMKRVAAVVEKYEGFLNLANEPGVFAAEVSLPL
ncbi:GHKL domain-containing protein [Thermophilibacter provencensis]|uniref:GHKL domain-containing protein n=1 Tax=Thermophilibacter provencensis TaxID=1852386 RepID=UPI00094AF834|nr:GHKL domain-containing protein [Thermophilibacter provencensis]